LSVIALRTCFAVGTILLGPGPALLLGAARRTVVVSAANMSSSIALVARRRQLALCPAALLDPRRETRS